MCSNKTTGEDGAITIINFRDKIYSIFEEDTAHEIDRGILRDNALNLYNNYF